MDGARFLHADFAALMAAAMAQDPFLGPILRQSQLQGGLIDKAGRPVPAESTSTCSSFFARDGLHFRRSSRSDRICIPKVPDLRHLTLTELYATYLSGHFGRDKKLLLAQRSVWWPSLAAGGRRNIRQHLPHLPARQSRAWSPRCQGPLSRVPCRCAGAE